MTKKPAAARFGASYDVKNPGSYNTDYSKWDRVADSDSDDEVSAQPKPVSKEPEMDENDKMLLRASQMTQECQMRGDEKGMEAAMAMARQALHAKGVPEDEINNVMQQEQQRTSGVMPPAPAPVAPSGPLNVSSAQSKMNTALNSANDELDRIRNQQASLENINGPEEFFQFMEQQGMDEEMIQRMMSGDMTVIEEAVKSQGPDLETTETVAQVDALAAQIAALADEKSGLIAQQNEAIAALEHKKKAHKKTLSELKQVEDKKKDAEQALVDCEDVLKASQPDSSSEPKHTFSHSDGEVTVSVELPGVSSVADVELDIADRMMTVEAGEWELMLPLPEVDEDCVKAKFVKESSTLVVTLRLC